MLSAKKITITADTVIGETKVATFGAVLNAETADVNMYVRYNDKEACKEHRDIVRADQAEFEDSVYNLQDLIKNQYGKD